MVTDIRNQHPQVSIEHIELNDKGVAKLVGHRIKVEHIAALKKYHGLTADQIQSEAYPHLSLSQIHAALAYYYDHREEIDRQMKEGQEFAERERQKQQNDPDFQARVARMKARAAERK
ncbi:MAG: DUF433 domain-containing protein [Planctomycetaceae bacterium]|nr:DUF433 domain-containing protein [Planctomycetaceae bacterium]